MQDSQRLTMTIPEVAKVLGVSRGLAYQLAKQDGLPGISVLHLGKRLLVSRQAIERLLQQGNERGDERS